jgi:hypothetical protein
MPISWLKQDLFSFEISGRRREFAFLAVRFSKSAVSYFATVLVQLYLINQYPPSLNSSYQLSLKWVALLQLLFVSGYGFLALNASQNQERYQALWRWFRSYQFFNFLLALLVSVVFYACSGLRILGIGNSLSLPLILAISLFLGVTAEVSSFRYALKDHIRYEYGSLITAVASTVLIFSLCVTSRFASYSTPLLCSLLLIATFFPLIIYNFSYMSPPPKALARRIESIATCGAVDRISPVDLQWPLAAALQNIRLLLPEFSLLKKAKSFQALQVVAAISWGTDILLIGALGSPIDVNQASFVLSLFSFASIVASLYWQRFQIFYSDRASRGVLDSFLGPKASHCLLFSLPSFVVFVCVLFAWSLASSAQLLFGSFYLVSSIAVSTVVSQLASLQGVYLNAANMPGRQVLNQVIFIIPLNICLSIYLYPLFGASGVFAATVVSLFCSVIVNSVVIHRHSLFLREQS